MSPPKTNFADGTPTLRDYFMIHAPVVPAWFEPVMLTPRPLARASATAAQAEAAEAWYAEHEKQQLLQWPAAWADEMMNRRNV